MFRVELPARGRPLRVMVCLLAVALGLAGCATLPKGEKPDPRDRFERFNRSIYAFNVKVDHAVLRPVARTYVKVTPQPIRTSVHNVVDNLIYTRTIINDFLQGKFRDFETDTSRFLINTIFGLGGIFDTASRAGLDRHRTDFGQTLGIWGVHSGPYLMLPLLGPSTVRDAIGLLPDEYMTPSPYIRPAWIPWVLSGVEIVDLRTGLLDQDKLLDSSYDPYALVRNVWLQRRDYLIHGDAPLSPEEQFPDQGDEAGSTPPAQH
jgi:phospholipid-binding lipoprotein MlaA